MRKMKTAAALWLTGTLTVCIMACAGKSGAEADLDNMSYEELLGEMLKYGETSETFNDLEGTLASVAFYALQNSEDASAKGMTDETRQMAADKLAQRFSAEQLTDVMVEIIAPYYKKEVSLDELKEYVAAARDEKVQTAVQNTMIAVKNADIEGNMQANVEQLMSGACDVPPMEETDCPDSYKKLFNEYYGSSYSNNMMENAFSSLDQMSGISDNEETSNAFKAITDYIKANTKTLLLNSFVGTVTEDDLNALIKLQNMESTQAVTRAGLEMSKNLLSVSGSIFGKFSEWLETAVE